MEPSRVNYSKSRQETKSEETKDRWDKWKTRGKVNSNSTK
jgi:hypothetical protein